MTPVGNVYGEALYDLARAEGYDEIILKELDALGESFSQEPDFLRLLSAANLSKEERCKILDDSFRGKVHPFVLNFMKLLTERGYAKHFPQCCESYRQHYEKDHGILPVTAVTAVPLTDNQSARLCEKLARLTGNTIRLTNRVKPDCLGGIRLDFGGKRLDDTVAHRLQNIRSVLKTEVL